MVHVPSLASGDFSSGAGHGSVFRHDCLHVPTESSAEDILRPRCAVGGRHDVHTVQERHSRGTGTSRRRRSRRQQERCQRSSGGDEGQRSQTVLPCG